MILLHNFLIYIIFIILFQLLTEVKPQDSNVKSDLRNAHTATLIDNKLYILGGNGVGKAPPYPTFLYLDVSDSIDTNRLQWHDLTNINSIPPHKYAAAIKGGANNTILFLYGGISLNNEGLNNLVYTFDTQNNVLKIPTITGTPPNGKVSINPVIDHNGLIYLFGGYSTEFIYTNDMFILDSINLSWKNVNSINAPSPRAEYGAVFLPNKNIIYIGM
jgi:N-acetylneuraminic acid mutarotase